MIMPQPTPTKVEINLKPVKLKVLPAVLLSLAVLVWIVYFNNPVFCIRFLAWVPVLGFVMLPLLGIVKARKIIKYVYVFLALWVLGAILVSSGLFRAKSYRGLIGEITSTSFSELVSPVKLDQIPTVDREFASLLAEKKLGEDFALGSRVTLGKPTRQMVKGRLFWVVPLLHSGFFKWLANTGKGTPGYIMVSATNPQDISFVREVNGKEVNIIYQPNAFFGQDLRRHIYLHGYMNRGIGDFTFEIDDAGEPYWTTTLYNHKIGVMGGDAVSMVTVHAGTGKIGYYELGPGQKGMDDSKIPAWVDRVQPADFVVSQLDWWGKYVNGFWNTVFGKRDMLMVTPGYNIVYGDGNRSYFYTGMSSVGSDEGTVGFLLTDTRSKRTHLYKMSGATEYAAMSSAEGKVQNFKYSATFPILVNINGAATYFMPLKDGAGLVKQFAFVSVKDFSVVGVGESIKAARDNYQMTLASSRVGTLAEGSAERIEVSGTVSRIGSDIKEARTYYYLSLNEKPGQIYIATTDLSSYLPVTRAGDRVTIAYLDTRDVEINLVALRNEDLEQAPQ